MAYNFLQYFGISNGLPSTDFDFAMPQALTAGSATLMKHSASSVTAAFTPPTFTDNHGGTFATVWGIPVFVSRHGLYMTAGMSWLLNNPGGATQKIKIHTPSDVLSVDAYAYEVTGIRGFEGYTTFNGTLPAGGSSSFFDITGSNLTTRNDGNLIVGLCDAAYKWESQRGGGGAWGVPNQPGDHSPYTVQRTGDVLTMVQPTAGPIPPPIWEAWTDFGPWPFDGAAWSGIVAAFTGAPSTPPPTRPRSGFMMFWS